jgi:hypothetical protein
MQQRDYFTFFIAVLIHPPRRAGGLHGIDLMQWHFSIQIRHRLAGTHQGSPSVRRSYQEMRETFFPHLCSFPISYLFLFLLFLLLLLFLFCFIVLFFDTFFPLPPSLLYLPCSVLRMP